MCLSSMRLYITAGSSGNKEITDISNIVVFFRLVLVRFFVDVQPGVLGWGIRWLMLSGTPFRAAILFPRQSPGGLQLQGRMSHLSIRRIHTATPLPSEWRDTAPCQRKPRNIRLQHRLLPMRLHTLCIKWSHNMFHLNSISQQSAIESEITHVIDLTIYCIEWYTLMYSSGMVPLF